MASRGFDKGGFWPVIGLGVLAVVTVALCVMALTRDVSADIGAADPTVGQSGEPTDAPGDEASEPTPSGSASAESEPVPEVPDLRDADFTEGDDLPDGARVYDNESVGSAMTLAEGVLTHGPPTGPGAISSLETRLATPVRKLTAQVRFAEGESGSVVLVGWADSLVAARGAGQPVPQSGLRLVAGPESWELTVYDKRPETIASGTYPRQTRAAELAVYRDGATAWVVTPDGTTTQVEDPRIESQTGPWACWQLLESSADQAPALIGAVTAG